MARGFATVSLLALAFGMEAFPADRCGAQEIGAPPQADPCAGRSAGKEMWSSDEAMRACRQEQLDKSEADLAAIVGRLSVGYGDDPERVAALKAANDTWLRFRDAECELLNIDSASGTMYDVYLTECLSGKNVERIAQMQWLLDHP